jgi:hypothetical protein
MMEILSKLWVDLGAAGHIAIYMTVMSLLAMIVQKIPGPLGVWLKKIVDVLSANLQHK